MARKNQKLINYHTGDKTRMPELNKVDYGEIVVRHNAESPELLIKVDENSFGVFQASGAVKSAIDSAVSTLNTDISNLEKSLTGHVATFEQFQTDVQTTYATKEELKSTSGSIISDYTTAIGNLASDLNELSGVVSSITENYVTTGGLNTTVEELEGKISSAKTEAIGKASGYTDTQIAAAKKEIYDSATSFTTKEVNTLSGNVHTTITNVQTALTETINNKVSKVYRYKGSCAYAELPTSGNVTGDVWNVTDAHDNVPAGTNYAWDGASWDALAGIVDLTIYATSADTVAAIKVVDDKFGSYATSADTESAIATAKSEAVSSGKGYTDGQISAVTSAYTKADADLASSIEAVSGSVSAFSATVVSDYATKVIASGYAMTAEANAVASGKGYTDGEITKVTTAYAEADSNLDARIDELEAISAHTQSAVQNVVVANTDANKITATKTDENNVVTLNFDNMVIDCGDF